MEENKSPVIMFFDIESFPYVSYQWGLYNASSVKVLSHNSILLFGYKKICEGNKGKFNYLSVKDFDSYKDFIEAIHDVVSDVDIAVGYNSVKFDSRFLKREFARFDLDFPVYKEVDLYREVKRNFLMGRNSLNFVGKFFGIGSKVYDGVSIELFEGCLNNDESSWKKMINYNRRDVIIVERLYFKLRKYIQNHPNYAIYKGSFCCSKCGSEKIQRRGYYYNKITRMARFQCKDCRSYSSGKVEKRLSYEQ